MDGHMGLANSFSLTMAGITNYTQDPVGGTVMKTADGGKIWSRLSLVFDYIGTKSWYFSELQLDKDMQIILSASYEVLGYAARKIT